jgi:hypothetical protein
VNRFCMPCEKCKRLRVMRRRLCTECRAKQNVVDMRINELLTKVESVVPGLKVETPDQRNARLDKELAEVIRDVEISKRVFALSPLVGTIPKERKPWKAPTWLRWMFWEVVGIVFVSVIALAAKAAYDLMRGELG